MTSKTGEETSRPTGADISLNKLISTNPGTEIEPAFTFSNALDTGWFLDENTGDIAYTAGGCQNITQNRNYTEFKKPLLIVENDDICLCRVKMNEEQGILYKKPGDDGLWWKTINGVVDLTDGLAWMDNDGSTEGHDHITSDMHKSGAAGGDLTSLPKAHNKPVSDHDHNHDHNHEHAHEHKHKTGTIKKNTSRRAFDESIVTDSLHKSECKIRAEVRNELKKYLLKDDINAYDSNLKNTIQTNKSELSILVQECLDKIKNLEIKRSGENNRVAYDFNMGTNTGLYGQQDGNDKKIYFSVDSKNVANITRDGITTECVEIENAGKITWKRNNALSFMVSDSENKNDIQVMEFTPSQVVSNMPIYTVEGSIHQPAYSFAKARGSGISFVDKKLSFTVDKIPTMQLSENIDMLRPVRIADEKNNFGKLYNHDGKLWWECGNDRVEVSRNIDLDAEFNKRFKSAFATGFDKRLSDNIDRIFDAQMTAKFDKYYDDKTNDFCDHFVEQLKTLDDSFTEHQRKVESKTNCLSSQIANAQTLSRVLTDENKDISGKLRTLTGRIENIEENSQTDLHSLKEMLNKNLTVIREKHLVDLPRIKEEQVNMNNNISSLETQLETKASKNDLDEYKTEVNKVVNTVVSHKLSKIHDNLIADASKGLHERIADISDDVNKHFASAIDDLKKTDEEITKAQLIHSKLIKELQDTDINNNDKLENYVVALEELRNTQNEFKTALDNINRNVILLSNAEDNIKSYSNETLSQLGENLSALDTLSKKRHATCIGRIKELQKIMGEITDEIPSIRKKVPEIEEQLTELTKISEQQKTRIETLQNLYTTLKDSPTIAADDGTVDAPSYQFANDAGTGLFHAGSSTLGITAGSKLSISSGPDDVTLYKPLVVKNTQSSMPAVFEEGHLYKKPNDTGLWWATSDKGERDLTRVNFPLSAPNSRSNNPAYTFNTDKTGLYGAADHTGIVIDGNINVEFTKNVMQVHKPIEIFDSCTDLSIMRPESEKSGKLLKKSDDDHLYWVTNDREICLTDVDKIVQRVHDKISSTIINNTNTRTSITESDNKNDVSGSDVRTNEVKGSDVGGSEVGGSDVEKNNVEPDNTTFDFDEPDANGLSGNIQVIKKQLSEQEGSNTLDADATSIINVAGSNNNIANNDGNDNSSDIKTENATQITDKLMSSANNLADEKNIDRYGEKSVAETIQDSTYDNDMYLATDGSFLTPSYSFRENTDTGIYLEDDNVIGFAADHGTRATIGNNGISVTTDVNKVDVPSYNFIENNNTGIGYTDQKLQLVVDGSSCIEIAKNMVDIRRPIKIPNCIPDHSDNNKLDGCLYKNGDDLIWNNNAREINLTNHDIVMDSLNDIKPGQPVGVDNNGMLDKINPLNWDNIDMLHSKIHKHDLIIEMIGENKILVLYLQLVPIDEEKYRLDLGYIIYDVNYDGINTDKKIVSQSVLEVFTDDDESSILPSSIKLIQINKAPRRYLAMFQCVSGHIIIGKIHVQLNEYAGQNADDITMVLENFAMREIPPSIDKYAVTYELDSAFDVMCVVTYDSESYNIGCFLCRTNFDSEKEVEFCYETESLFDEILMENKDLLLISTPGQTVVGSYGNVKFVVMLPSDADNNISVGEITIDNNSFSCVDLFYDRSNAMIMSIEKTISDASFIQVLDIFGSKLQILRTKKLIDNNHKNISNTMHPFRIIKTHIPDTFMLFYVDYLKKNTKVQIFTHNGETIKLNLIIDVPTDRNGTLYDFDLSNKNQNAFYLGNSVICTWINKRGELYAAKYNMSMGLDGQRLIGIVRDRVNSVADTHTYHVTLKGRLYKNEFASLSKKFLGRKIYLNVNRIDYRYPHNLTTEPNGNIYVGTCLSIHSILVGI